MVHIGFSGFRLRATGFRVHGVQGLRFRTTSLGFRV